MGYSKSWFVCLPVVFIPAFTESVRKTARPISSSVTVTKATTAGSVTWTVGVCFEAPAAGEGSVISVTMATPDEIAVCAVMVTIRMVMSVKGATAVATEIRNGESVTKAMESVSALTIPMATTVKSAKNRRGKNMNPLRKIRSNHLMKLCLMHFPKIFLVASFEDDML